MARLSLSHRVIFAALTFAWLTPAAPAQFNYTLNGGANFTNTIGWNFGNGPVPFSSTTGSLTTFGYGTANFTSNNDLNLTLQSMQLSNFSNATVTFGSTIAGNFAFTGPANIQFLGSGATTVSAPVALSSTATGLTFSGSGLGNITLSSALSSNTATAAPVTINTTNLPTAGLVSLNGANTFTTSGGVVLTSGSLSLGNAAALGVFGSTFNSLTVTGGTLASNVAILNPIVTSGANLVIADPAGSTGTYNGVISGNGGVEVRSGGSAVTQTFNAINTYTGATVIDIAPLRVGQTTSPNQAGIFNLASAVGSITGNTAGVSVSAGGTFNINKSAGDSVNNLRISTANAITSTSGIILVTGSAGFTTQNFGTINAAGQTTIVANVGASGSNRINIGNLVRSSNSVVVFSGVNLNATAAGPGINTSNINVAQINGAAPTAVFNNGAGFLTSVGGTQAAGTPGLSIIPWAIGDSVGSAINANIYGAGTGFVTLDSIGGGIGVRLLNTTTEYNTGNNFNTAASTDNMRITAAVTSPVAATSVNSIFVNFTGQTIGGGPGIPISVNSGAIASNVAAVTFTSTILAPGELVISPIGTLLTANTITASGPLIASTLTKGGQGILVLGDNTNLFTANLITINGGFLQVTNLAQLGINQAAPGSSTIAFNMHSFQNQGGLNYNTGTTDVLNSNIIINSGHIKLNANTATTNVTLAGLISGNGGVNINTDTAGGTVILANNANSFRGGVRVGSGVAQNFQFTGDGALGDPTGNITINATVTTMKILGPWTTNRNIAFQAGLGQFDTNGFASAWGGPITGGGNMTRVDSSGTPSVWSITSGNNSYTGAITLGTAALPGGTLALVGNGALSSAAIVVGVTGNTNATFDISGANGPRQVASLAGIAGTSIILGSNDLTAGSTGTTVASTISGTGRFIKAGPNTMVLSGTNTHLGTEVRGGSLSISSDANLGDVTGTFAMRGGNLTVTSSVTFDALRPVVIDSTPARLGGDAPSNSFSIGTGLTLTIPGPVTGGGGYEKGGTGALVFTGLNTSGSSLANPSSGFIKINQGAVVFNSDSNIGLTASGSFPGTKILLLSLGATISNTVDNIGTIRLAPGNGAVTINRYIAFQNANSNQAAISVGAGSDLTYSGTLVSGSNAQTFFKTGDGTLTFNANAAQFNGTFSIGSGLAGGTTGNVALTATANLSRTTVSVAANSGATLDMSGLTKDFGGLALATGTTLQLGAGGSLTTGWNNGAPAIAGTIASTGPTTIVQTGTGAHTYSVAQTFSGSYTTLFVGGTTLNAAGAFGPLTRLTLGSVGNNSNLGPTLTLDNATASVDRIADAQTVFFNNANLSFTTNAAITTEVMDSFAAAGATMISMQAGGTVNFASATSGYTRVNRGTTLVRSASTGTIGTAAATATLPNVIFGNLSAANLFGLPGGTGVQTPILPYIVSNDTAAAGSTGNTFASYGANGITALLTGSQYSTTFVDATTNVRTGISTTFTGADGQANCFIITGTANSARFDGAALENLILDSGGLANTVTQVYGINAAGTAGSAMGIQTAELRTGAGNTRELIIHNLNADLAIGARITTSGGLTKTGGYTAFGSTLFLTNTNNNYLGGTTVNAGTLAIDSLSAINPTPANGLTLSGGYLKYRGSNVTFPAGVPIVLGGGSAANLGATGGLNVVSGSTLDTAPAAIAGFGGLLKDGTGQLILRGANTFGGPINLQSGVIAFDSPAAMGSYPRLFTDTPNVAGNGVGSAFRFLNTMTVNKDFFIVTSTAANGIGFDVPTAGNTATITGVVSSPNNNGRGLYKFGAGDLVLQGANTHSGATQVFGGNLILSGPNGSALSSGQIASQGFINASTFVAGPGGNLVLDNTAANNNNRLPDPFTSTITGGQSATQSGIRLVGGGFTLIGNTAAATNEVTNQFDIFIGTVTLVSNGQNTSLTTGRVTRTDNATVALVRGTNLGAPPGPGTTNWFAIDMGSGSTQLVGAGGALSTPFINTVPGFMGDASPTGSGTDLMTYDSRLGFRMLTASEYSSAPLPLTNFDASRAPNQIVSGALPVPLTSWVSAVKLTAGGSIGSGSSANLNIMQSTILATGDSSIDAPVIGSFAGNGAYDILVAGPNTILTIRSALSGQELYKYGDGRLNLRDSVYGGGSVIVGNGTLALVSSQAALNPIGSAVTVLPGATLDLGGIDRTISSLNTLSLIGTFNAGQVSDGTVTLGIGNSRLRLYDGASTTFTGAITGTGSLVKAFNATGTTTFTSPLTYSGSTSIFGGTLQLAMNGTLPSSIIDIRGGGLTFNNSDDGGAFGGYVANRLSAFSSINLAGTITFTENANTPAVHSLNEISLVGGGNLTITNGANAPSTLTIANLNRSGSLGTLVVNGTNLGLTPSPTGNARVLLTNINGAAPALAFVGGAGGVGTTTQKILPWAWSTTGSFFTLDATNGLRPLSTTTEYAAVFPGAPSDDNVRLVAVATLAAGTTEVNSVIQTSTAITGVAGDASTLTIRSGALALTGAATVAPGAGGTMNLNFGATNTAEGVVFTGAASVITASITTSGGLTKFGGNNLTLNSNANTFGGGLTINAGTISIASDNNLGAAGGGIRFGGPQASPPSAQLIYNGTTAFLPFNRPVVTTSAGAFTGVAGGVWNFQQPVDGDGAIGYVTANAVFEPNSGNSYTGASDLFGGVIAVPTDSVFGSGGEIRLSGAHVLATADWSTNRLIQANAASQVNTGRGNVTWNGPLVGGGAIAKFGANDLIFTQPLNYTGAITLNAGNIRFRDRGAFPTGMAAQVFGTGAGIIFDDSGLHFGDRYQDNGPAIVFNNSGIITLIGNSATTSEEVINSLTFSGTANVMTIVPGAGQAAILRLGQAGVLTRGAGAAVLYRGTNLGVNVPGSPDTATFTAFNPLLSIATLTGGGGPANNTAISILAQSFGDTTATGLGTQLVTFDFARGVRLLNPATEYATTLNNGTVMADNIRLTGGAATVANPTAVNALWLENGASVDGAGTLTVTANTVLASGAGNSLGSAVLANGAPANTLAICVVGAGDLTMNSVLTTTTTTGGIAKYGAGNLIFPAANANTYTGGTQIFSGTVTVGNATSLGAAAAGVRFLGNGGALQSSVNGLAISYAFNLDGDMVVAGANDITLNGTLALNSASRTITATNTGATTIGATISTNSFGQGLTKAGPGLLVLSGNNTYGSLAANFYDSRTIINSGDLSVRGQTNGTGASTNSGTGGSLVVVNAGGTLSGNGWAIPQQTDQSRNTVAINAGGTLSPGLTSPAGANTSAVLCIGNTQSTGTIAAPDLRATVNLNADAKFRFFYTAAPASASIDSGSSTTAGTGNNLLSVNGALAWDANAIFKIVGNLNDFTLTSPYSFLVATATSVNAFDTFYSTSPSRFDVSQFANFTPGLFDMQVHNVGTGSVIFNVYAVIPEPAGVLALCALTALATRRLRRQSTK